MCCVDLVSNRLSCDSCYFVNFFRRLSCSSESCAFKFSMIMPSLFVTTGTRWLYHDTRPLVLWSEAAEMDMNIDQPQIIGDGVINF